MAKEQQGPHRSGTERSRPSLEGSLLRKSVAIPVVVLGLVALSVVGAGYLIGHVGPSPVPRPSKSDSPNASAPPSGPPASTSPTGSTP